MKLPRHFVNGAMLLALLSTMTLAACGSVHHSAAIPEGGSVTVVPSPYGKFSRNFNPFLALNNTAMSGTAGLIFESLLYINRLNGTVQPWLATSYSWSPDVKSLTFNLRSHVTWTDGAPFTSADVAYTVQTLRQNPSVDIGQLGPKISQIATPDPATVIITFTQPSPSAIWYLGGQLFVVPQHIWNHVSHPDTNDNPDPIGTGPFMLQSFSASLYVLAKNPHYWQPGKPYVSEVRYPAYDSNTGAGLLLAQGTIDWTGVYAPDIQQVFVGLDPAHNHYWFPPVGVSMLYLNLTKAPFNQLAVRQAISQAIDRGVLSQQAESGYEPPANPTAILLPGYQSALSSTYATTQFSVNDAQARSLLEQAGFHSNQTGTVADSSGHPLTFTLQVVAGWNDWVAMAGIVKQDLQRIGISVQVLQQTYVDYLSNLKSGQYDAAISWTANGPSPYFLYNGLLNSANSAPIGQVAQTNWERWTDPASDALIAQFASTTDTAKQNAALGGLEQIMVDQLPAIPLTNSVSWYEYSTARFVGWPTAMDAYTAPSPYAYPDNEIVLLHLHRP